MSLSDLEIRALQALRAGGMTAAEAGERWSDGTNSLYALRRKGLVILVDDVFQITVAGRAACPFRNPLAAPGARPALQEIPMSKETVVTRQQVLAAIVAAGPAGMLRRALIAHFDISEGCIDNHITLLNRADPPVIYKPEPGRCVAIEYKLAAPLNAEALRRGPSTGLRTGSGQAQSKAEKGEEEGKTKAEKSEMPAVPPSPLAGEGQGERGAAPAVNPEFPPKTPTRYAVAFPGEFYDTIEDAVSRAVEFYEAESLKDALVICCTPIGRIDLCPVFVPSHLPVRTTGAA